MSQVDDFDSFYRASRLRLLGFVYVLTGNLAEAQLLYRQASARPDFETFRTPPDLSIVPLRHVPDAVEDLDAHNQALADAIQADGRVYLASALIEDRVWLRPCFVNYRTTDEDVLAVLDVAAELGERIARGRR